MTQTCPVAHWAERTPDKVALISGAQRWTYAQLDRAVSGWVAHLRAQDVGPGARVGVYSRNHPGVVALFHAVARVGAVYVPFNARLTASEVEALARRVQPKVWVEEEDLGTTPEPTFADHITLPPSQEVRAILFTSGTTGVPRGAELTYANFDAAARASLENLGGGQEQVWLACMPLFHVGGLTMAHRCAQYGATLVLHEKFDAGKTWEALEEQGVTHLSVVSTQLRWLLEARTHRAPSTVRAVLVGGGPVNAALMAQASSRGFPVLQTYGLTETCAQVCTERPGHADGSTAGSPLPGTSVRVSQGELEVKGPTVMRGYLDDAEATRARISPDGWLRTGDLGAVDAQGRVTVFSRRTDLIVTGGENVYPAEVEAVLATHPDIAEAAVIGVDDEVWGQIPAALVVPRSPSLRAPESLAAWCRERLAGFKVPRRIHPVESLPKTGAGKVDRARLRAIALEQERSTNRRERDDDRA